MITETGFIKKSKVKNYICAAIFFENKNNCHINIRASLKIAIFSDAHNF